MKRPLSAIIKEMVLTILRRPGAPPSAEAAHAALLLAHIAWNRRTDSEAPDYRLMLGEFEASNPNLWDELKSTDPASFIIGMINAISLSAACVGTTFPLNGCEGSPDFAAAPSRLLMW
jgi:hypothetical protein